MLLSYNGILKGNPGNHRRPDNPSPIGTRNLKQDFFFFYGKTNPILKDN